MAAKPASRRRCDGASFGVSAKKHRAAHDWIDDGQNSHDRLQYLVKACQWDSLSRC
jgi:hypothetical protein